MSEPIRRTYNTPPPFVDVKPTTEIYQGTAHMPSGNMGGLAHVGGYSPNDVPLMQDILGPDPAGQRSVGMHPALGAPFDIGSGCVSQTDPYASFKQYFPQSVPNPKTLMGRLKVAMLSVIPPAALAYLGLAMQYGAYDAPKKDGSKGYGPFNWRETKIESMVYIDAAIRHLAEWTDGQELAEDSQVPHLAHAMATIAILIDAIENGSVIDTRPKVRSGVVSRIFTQWRKTV